MGAHCTPLVATVGIEGEGSPGDGSPQLEPSEAGVASMDAAAADDASTPSDDAASLDDGGDANPDLVRNCIVLPDLVDVVARTDGGISALDSGVIWLATDAHQCCPMPVVGNYVYGRVDGTPMVPAGAPHSIRWPATIGTGPVTMLATQVQCGGEPLVLPFFISFVIPLIEGCATATPGAYLRIAMNPPSPFPLGLRLCEGGCQ